MFYPNLFKPANLGNTWIRNRVVMAPMFTNFASTTGEVTDELVAHYAARARGGAGMIIVEAACVSPELCNQGPSQLHISHQRFVIGLNRLSDAIRSNGCRALIQLNHPGRQTTSLYCGGQPVAPSAVACQLMKELPRELAINEIKQISRDFIAAAHYANLAGFDGVEIHAAHGYLINQFLSPRTNLRQDVYGGRLENRQRFLLDLITRIKSELPNLILSVRLNIDDFIDDGFGLPESLQVCQSLEKAGVDIIHCSTGTYESGLKSVEPDCYPEGWRIYLAEAVKKTIDIPVIAGGMIRSPEYADKIIAEGRSDFVFLGRPLLADPQWPNKAGLGLTSTIRPCIGCNGCIDDSFKGLGIRCTVNPQVGRGNQDNHSYCSRPARAVVVGGGPAGMQAALSLQRHGIATILFEAKSHLGGLMPVAAVPPFKEKIKKLCEYMIQEMERSGIDIRKGVEFKANTFEHYHPDVVVIATGSRPNQIKWKNLTKQYQALDILTGLEKNLVQPVIVIGGGRTGCETADYLASHNHQVEIIEKKDYLAMDMERKNRRALMDRLRVSGVLSRTGCEIVDIQTGKVKIKTGLEEHEIEAGTIVWATGFLPANELYMQLHSQKALVFLIGDGLQVRGFRQAILEGESIGAMVADIFR